MPSSAKINIKLKKQEESCLSYTDRFHFSEARRDKIAANVGIYLLIHRTNRTHLITENHKAKYNINNKKTFLLSTKM